MKNILVILTFSLFSIVTIAQSSDVNKSDCNELSNQIARMHQQLDNLDQRESICKSRSPIDQKQLDQIIERKELVNAKLEKYTLIQAENCNPNIQNNSIDQMNNSSSEINENQEKGVKPKVAKEPSNSNQAISLPSVEPK